MKLTTSVASALSAVTQTGTGPAQTIAGTPNDDYQGISKVVPPASLVPRRFSTRSTMA